MSLLAPTCFLFIQYNIKVTVNHHNEAGGDGDGRKESCRCVTHTISGRYPSNSAPNTGQFIHNTPGWSHCVASQPETVSLSGWGRKA